MQDFSNDTSGSNICLGKLVTSVVPDQYKQPLGLPSQGEIVGPNDTCVMTGWGYTSVSKFEIGKYP